MNKRTITFLVFLILASFSSSFSQQYFFYHFKDKKTLTQKEQYISVKFKENSLTQTNQKISSQLKPYTKSIMEFKTRRDNSDNSEIIICRLNDYVTNNNLILLKNNLSKQENVETIGYAFSSGDRVIHFTTNEIIVKFKSYVSTTDIKNINTYFKTKLIEKVSLFDDVYLLSIESNGNDSKDNVFDVANKYALTSMVEFAQPNFIRYGMLLNAGHDDAPHFSQRDVRMDSIGGYPYTPNDTMLPRMWHINNTGSNYPDTGVYGIPGCDLNMLSAWDITKGDPNVMISIVDTGIDTNHVDLSNNLSYRESWYDFYANDPYPFDEYFHGTGVSGCTAAEGDNISGIAGVAYRCKIIPVRVFGPYSAPFTTDLILAKGLNWAWMKGASAINCSWGGGIPVPIITHAIQNAVHFGRSGRGTLVFGGAGNDDTDIVIYPGSMEEVIGVGGLSPCNTRKSKHSCDFNGLDSNQYWGACYGNDVDIVAPCTFIGTTELFGGWCICGNGTSVSSPIAAAVAALIMSKNNSLSGDSVRAILERSALRVGNYSYNIQKEHGSWNYEMGYGRIDARAALDMVTQGSGSIGDQVPPGIIIHPQESKVFNSLISFNAEITDNTSISGGSNSPRLYFRTIQHTQIQSALGVPDTGNTYKFTFPLIPYSEGFYYYISAQDNSTVPNVTTYPIGGKGYNPPGFMAPAKFMFVRNTAVFETTFVSNDVPVNIPGNGFATLFSDMDNVAGRVVLDINCTVNIAHTFTADLTLSLISPSGTEIVLLSGIGWDSDSLKNTTLDDEALMGIDDTLAEPPFTGTYKPVEKLWLFDGEPAGGQWKLKIVDNGFGDGGTLTYWNMKFKFAAIDDNVILPGTFSLVKNYPNPFNPKTRIVFNVPRTAFVRILLYDVSGKLVKILLNESRSPKLEDYVDFDASELNGGRGLASGVYFYTLIADDEFIDSRRMVLVK